MLWTRTLFDTLIVVCALGQEGFHKQTSRRLFVVKTILKPTSIMTTLSQTEFILRLPPCPDSHAGTLRTTDPASSSVDFHCYKVRGLLQRVVSL